MADLVDPDLGPITEEDWAQFRREAVTGLPPELHGLSLPDILMPPQAELLAATAMYQLVVADKSRRVGFTWAVGSDAVLTAGAARSAGGMDVLYIGYNLDMAREFIDCCAMWARSLAPACTSTGEFLFDDMDAFGNSRKIQAFRIGFQSGFEIVALSSRPRSLRGRQGYVVLDEYAFHDDPKAVLEAALAFLIWGGKVLVVSTHNGVDNPFNELIQEIHSGERPGKVVRCTFDDAIAAGLYVRVCLQRGLQWSAEAEARWRADIYKTYGSGADQELRCIPSNGGGVYLPRALIEARMHNHVPVIRWQAPPGFVDWPEFRWTEEISAFCESAIAPALARLDPRLRSALGQDFGRSGDLSVIHPVQIRSDLRRTTPFILELRDTPFAAQRQILVYICDALPRLSCVAIDATGNGAAHAEAARQKYGPSIVHEIKLSLDWYRQYMPRLKAAFEDGGIELPRDDDILTDYRAIRMVDGVAKVPANARSTGADGFERHGDAAPAGALMIYASIQDAGEVRVDFAGVPRPAAEGAAAFLSGGYDDVPFRADTSDFLRM